MDSDKYIQIPYCKECRCFMVEYEQTIERVENESIHLSIDTYPQQKKNEKARQVPYVYKEAFSAESINVSDVDGPKCLVCKTDVTMIAVPVDLAKQMFSYMDDRGTILKCDFDFCPEEFDSQEELTKQAREMDKIIRKILIKTLL